MQTVSQVQRTVILKPEMNITVRCTLWLMGAFKLLQIFRGAAAVAVGESSFPCENFDSSPWFSV